VAALDAHSEGVHRFQRGIGGGAALDEFNEYDEFDELVIRARSPYNGRSLRLATLLFSIVALATGAERRAIGFGSNGTRIEAYIAPGPLDNIPTVVLIGGLAGEDESTRVVRQELLSFEAQSQNRRRARLVAIPLANPQRSQLSFPPAGVAYRENTESHYL